MDRVVYLFADVEADELSGIVFPRLGLKILLCHMDAFHLRSFLSFFH